MPNIPFTTIVFILLTPDEYIIVKINDNEGNPFNTEARKMAIQEVNFKKKKEWG